MRFYNINRSLFIYMRYTMIEIFTALIQQLNSSVFILLGILVFTFIAIAKVSNAIGKWTEKFSHQDKKIDKLENLSDKVVELSTKINLIYQNTNPNNPVRSFSPISLTKVGEEIVENIKAEEIFKKYSEKLIKDVELTNPKSAYDIQQLSMMIAREKMVSLLSEEELIIIKKEAFNKGLLIEDIMSVFGILLRNKVLADNNISIADVDKHS